MRRIALVFIMLSLTSAAVPRFSFETTEHVRPGDRSVVEEAMQAAMKYLRVESL